MPFTGEISIKRGKNWKTYPARLLSGAEWVVYQGLWGDPRPRAMAQVEIICDLPTWSKKWVKEKGLPTAKDRLRVYWVPANSPKLQGLGDVGDPGPKPHGKGSIRRMWKGGAPEVFGI